MDGDVANKEVQRQRVIMLLLQQLSNHIDAQSTHSAGMYLLKHGIITTDAIKELEQVAPEADEVALSPQLCNGSGKRQRVDAAPMQSREVTAPAMSRFDQDFERLELLGRGAFGEVWRCRHRIDGREYAVKAVRFHNDAADQGESTRRAVREAQTLANLEAHPGVLRYHNSWIELDQPALPGAGSWPTLSRSPSAVIHADISVASVSRLSSLYNDESDAGVIFGEPEESNLQIVQTPQEPAVPSRADVAQNCEKKIVKANQRPTATLYIQTDLCNKYTLDSWMSQRNAAVKSSNISGTEQAEWNKAGCEIFSQCVDAVTHLHKNDCMHRDIKPSNIFFGADGRVQIGDFGLAKTEAHTTDSGLPQVGDGTMPMTEVPASTSNHTGRLGTPTYASPEQLIGGQYGVEVDVYSLGIILAELLCPTRTHMERMVVLDQLRNEHRLPEEVMIHYPVAARLAVAMTESDPKDRPALCNLIKVMPQVLKEMRQIGCNESLAGAPKIEEVEELTPKIRCVIPISQHEEELDEQSFNLEPAQSTESSNFVRQECSGADTASDQHDEPQEEPKSEESFTGVNTPTKDSQQVAQQAERPAPEPQASELHDSHQVPDPGSNDLSKEQEMTIKKSTTSENSTLLRFDMSLFIFLLFQSGLVGPLWNSVGSGSGLSMRPHQSHSVRFSFGQTAPFSMVEWATFDFAHPDNGFINLAMETSANDEYKHTFIRIECEARNEGRGSNCARLLSGSLSSSSPVWAKSTVPAYIPLAAGITTSLGASDMDGSSSPNSDSQSTSDQLPQSGSFVSQQPASTIFTSVLNILSRCTTSGMWSTN